MSKPIENGAHVSRMAVSQTPSLRQCCLEWCLPCGPWWSEVGPLSLALPAPAGRGDKRGGRRSTRSTSPSGFRLATTPTHRTDPIPNEKDRRGANVGSPKASGVGNGPARSSAAPTTPAKQIHARARGLFEHGTIAHPRRPATGASPSIPIFTHNHGPPRTAPLNSRGQAGQGSLAGPREHRISEAGIAGDAHGLAHVEQHALMTLARVKVSPAGSGLQIATVAAGQHEPHRL